MRSANQRRPVSETRSRSLTAQNARPGTGLSAGGARNSRNAAVADWPRDRTRHHCAVLRGARLGLWGTSISSRRRPAKSCRAAAPRSSSLSRPASCARSGCRTGRRQGRRRADRTRSNHERRGTRSFAQRSLAERLNIARLHAALADRDDPVADFKPPADASPELISAQRQLLLDQVAEHRAKIAALARQQAQRKRSSPRPQRPSTSWRPIEAADLTFSIYSNDGRGFLRSMASQAPLGDASGLHMSVRPHRGNHAARVKRY